MNVFIIFCIITLGITVLRLAICGIAIFFNGKIPGTNKKVGLTMRLLNLAEVAAVVYAFVLLVMHFYGK